MDFVELKRDLSTYEVNFAHRLTFGGVIQRLLEKLNGDKANLEKIKHVGTNDTIEYFNDNDPALLSHRNRINKQSTVSVLLLKDEIQTISKSL